MLVVLTVLFVIIITVTILLIKFYQPCRDYFNFNTFPQEVSLNRVIFIVQNQCHLLIL